MPRGHGSGCIARDTRTGVRDKRGAHVEAHGGEPVVDVATHFVILRPHFVRLCPTLEKNTSTSSASAHIHGLVDIKNLLARRTPFCKKRRWRGRQRHQRFGHRTAGHRAPKCRHGTATRAMHRTASQLPQQWQPGSSCTGAGAAQLDASGAASLSSSGNAWSHAGKQTQHWHQQQTLTHAPVACTAKADAGI